MTTSVVVTIPHQLGRAEARRRMQGGFGRIREQIGGKSIAFSENWEDERLHFAAEAFGYRVSGRADVLDDSVRVELHLPWVLAAIAARLQHRVRSAATLLLEKK
jgi:hypothetical protein